MAINLIDALGQPVAPEAAPVPEEGGLPEEILQIPEMSALLAGTPPAVWASRDDPSPEIQTIVQNAPALEDAGFGFYGGKDGVTTVMFNTQHVSPEEIQAADNKGKLRDFATPFADLKASLGSATGAPAAPGPAAPPQMAAAAPAAGFDKKLATKRLKNLAVGAPTSGPSPGAGRILNSIMAPVV